MDSDFLRMAIEAVKSTVVRNWTSSSRDGVDAVSIYPTKVFLASHSNGCISALSMGVLHSDIVMSIPIQSRSHIPLSWAAGRSTVVRRGFEHSGNRLRIDTRYLPGASRLGMLLRRDKTVSDCQHRSHSARTPADLTHGMQIHRIPTDLTHPQRTV
jgi:hypothetical protein